MSAVKMRAGKSKSMNYWLRARVVLQGLTLVALVAGSMALQKQKNAQISDLGIDAAELPRNEATTELSKEKKRILEQREFEERLKAAEAAADQEKGVGMMVVKGPSVNKERREEEKKRVQTQLPDSDASQSPVLNEVKKSNSWLWWSNGKSSERQEEKKRVQTQTQTQQADSSQSPVLNEKKKSNSWFWWSSGKRSEQPVKSNDSDST
jgi:Hypoxia induced protein conserved region